MPNVSQAKRDKISEQILFYLYGISPESAFTAHIATEIARDEEFTKDLLLNLKKKELIAEINQSPNGLKYLRRQRWRLTEKAFSAYNSLKS